MNEVPPFGKHPKPKSQGKKKGPKKIKPQPEVKPLDVFKVALEADAGAESSRRSNFDMMIEHLSQSQLGQLEKMVQKLRGRTLKAKKATNKCDELASAIQSRSARSAEEETKLSLEIKSKLEHLSPKLKAQVANREISIRRMVKEHFSSEIETAKELMEQGVLIKRRSNQTAENYVERRVQYYLSPTSQPKGEDSL